MLLSPQSLFSKDNLVLFVFGLFLQLISKGSSLFCFTFNIDDIIFWSREYSYSTLLPTAIRDGRFSHPFLGGIEWLLGINPPLSFTVSILIFSTCISITAIAVCYIWGVQKNRNASLIVVGFITLHPYLTDFYTWRIATFNGGLPFVFSAISLLIVRAGNKSIVLASTIFMLSLGIHQIPLGFFSAVLACSSLFIYLRHACILECYIPTEYSSKDEIITLFKMVCVVVIGTITYIFFAKLYILTGNIQTLERDKLIIFQNLPLVVDRIKELLSLFLIKDPLISNFNRTLFLGLFAIFSIIVLSKSTTFFNFFKSILAIFLALVLAYISSIGLTIVSVAWIPVFRNLFSISLIWGMVAVLAYILSADLLRKITLGIICMLFLAFAAKDNEMLSNQIRANTRDISTMNRIAFTIEKLPDFSNIKKLYFVGTNSNSLQGLSTASDLSNGYNSYGTTLSIFAIPWNGYLVQFFNEITGYRMNSTTLDIGFKKSCIGHYWPQVDAVFSLENTAVICLGSSEIEYSPLDNRH